MLLTPSGSQHPGLKEALYTTLESATGPFLPGPATGFSTRQAMVIHWKQISPLGSRTFNAITSHDSVIYAAGGKYLYRFNEMDIVMHKVIGNGESGTVRRTPSEGAENEIGDTSE